MRHSFKFIGASALALTFAYGGYGAMQVAQGASVAPRGMANVAFAPAFRSDAAVVIGACLDKDRAWNVVDAFCDKVGAMSGAQVAEISELKAQLAAYKTNPFKDAPPEFRSFADEAGLNNVDLRWAVVSFDEMPDFSPGSAIPGGLSIAIAGNFDARRVLRAFEKKLKEKPGDAAEFKEESVEGETVWHLVPLNEKSAKEMKDNNVDLHVAWLDNQLLIASFSRGALVRQIRLFRAGEMKSDALRGFSAPGTVAGFFMSGFGDLMRRTVSPEQLEGLNAIPNGQQIFFGMKTLAIEIKSMSGADIRLSCRLGLASEADADVCRTLTKTGVMVGRAQLAQKPEESAELLKVLDGVKVGGVDGVLEITLDTTVSDLTDALAKGLVQAFTPKPKAGGPRGAGREGKARRRRRTNAAPADDLNTK